MSQTTWTLAQILVWFLLQFELSPQDAEQYCNDLKPKTIEDTLDALVEALFNALYGVVEGMPRTIAWIPCGHGYEDLTTFFRLPPSLESGALDALKNELLQFIRQNPNIRFNPIWGRWVRPVCVSAAPAAPTATRPTKSAVAESATTPTDPPSPVPAPVTSVSPPAVPPTEGGTASSPAELPPAALERANEETAPGSSHAAASAGSPANLPSVDPAMRLALVYALEKARPARAANVPVIAESVVSLPALLAKGSAPSTPDATPTPGSEVEPGSSPTPVTSVEVSEPAFTEPPRPTTNTEAPITEHEAASPPPETSSPAPARVTFEPVSTPPAAPPQVQRQPGGRPTDRDMVCEEASWRLRHEQTKAKSLVAFARDELRPWLEDHGEHRTHGDVMKAETIEDHVRSLWNEHRGKTP